MNFSNAGAEIVHLKKTGWLLIGGRFGSDAFNDQLWQFDLTKKQWNQIHAARQPPGRIAHCVVRIPAEKLALFVLE